MDDLVNIGKSGVVYANGAFITDCGLLKSGPKVRGLIERVGDNKDELERICSFVFVWHLLEWNDGKEPTETP